MLPATCKQHGDVHGFTNLVVTRLAGGVEFDVHAVGACVVTLDEKAARVVSEALVEWFG
ncbi:MAG: hypothetical protein ACRDTH_11845 [Pseudonocardiaceae bacterium]